MKGLRNRNVQAFNSSNRPNLRYPFYVDIDNPGENGLCKVSTVNQNGWIEVYPSTVNGLESVWRWGKAKSTAMIDSLVAYRGNDGEIRVFQKERKLTQTAKTVLKVALEDKYDELLEDKEIISNKGTKEVQELLGKGIFDFPKPIALIETFINIGTEEDDIILDFFSGSATTAHAVMKLNSNSEYGGNRKFIAIQLPEVLAVESNAYKAGYRSIDQIGMERIIRAAERIKEQHPETTADLGFKHYTLQEPSQNTLDKMEEFSPDTMIVDSTVLEQFGTPTILTTWLVHDGYGFNGDVETVALADYTAYWYHKHLYLIIPNMSELAIKALIEKYNNDGAFNPDNVVVFGYSFNWSILESLKTNLKILKDSEKNLNVNLDIRY